MIKKKPPQEPRDVPRVPASKFAPRKVQPQKKRALTEDRIDKLLSEDRRAREHIKQELRKTER
jgi:hypothetical protein